MIKLHLGCGNRHIPGYINIDFQRTNATDLVFNIMNIDKYFNLNSINIIYICHVLEHFSELESLELLKKLFMILKRGGLLRICVPDFNAICKRYNQTGNLKELIGLIVGRFDIPHEGHKMIWDFKSLFNYLKLIGFKNIYIYNWENTEHSNIDDFSQAYLPHMDKQNGLLMSLNIEAIK